MTAVGEHVTAQEHVERAEDHLALAELMVKGRETLTGPQAEAVKVRVGLATAHATLALAIRSAPWLE